MKFYITRTRLPRSGALWRLRSQLYGCFSSQAGALFELCDALLHTEVPLRALVGLTLVAERRRGGAMYDGLNWGRIDVERLRTMVAGLARCPARMTAD